MRADALAKRLNNYYYDFWKEVKVLSNCKTSLPSDIGASGTENILEKLCKHYHELFHCIRSKTLCGKQY